MSHSKLSGHEECNKDAKHRSVLQCCESSEISCLREAGVGFVGAAELMPVWQRTSSSIA